MFYIVGKNRRGEDAAVEGVTLVEADRRARSVSITGEVMDAATLGTTFAGQTIVLYKEGVIVEVTFTKGRDPKKVLALQPLRIARNL